MKGGTASILGTAQLVLYALLPAGQNPELVEAVPPETDGAVRCPPRWIRGDKARLLNSQGELRIFFANCLAIAAPAVLFRLKREGFSTCSVQVSEGGLLVRGRR